jgi:uncharacterized protein
MDTTSSTNTTSVLAKIALSVAIIGALNWGLIGLFNFNLVDAILGGGRVEETSTASRVLYAIVGLAGLIGAVLLPTLRRSDALDTRREPTYGTRL